MLSNLKNSNSSKSLIPAGLGSGVSERVGGQQWDCTQKHWLIKPCPDQNPKCQAGAQWSVWPIWVLNPHPGQVSLLDNWAGFKRRIFTDLHYVHWVGCQRCFFFFCQHPRLCSTAWSTPWRTSSTSSSSTSSSCSSSPSSPCSSSRASSSTAPTSPKVWRRTAGKPLNVPSKYSAHCSCPLVLTPPPWPPQGSFSGLWQGRCDSKAQGVEEVRLPLRQRSLGVPHALYRLYWRGLAHVSGSHLQLALSARGWGRRAGHHFF